MCGIVSYIGKKDIALKVLLTGLKNLEYRGYDSSGIAFLNDGKLEVIKAVGPIASLESKVDTNIKASVGIGHTRWATHGKPSEKNSHPHTVDKITLIHNGIIENYIELKKKLKSDGYTFKSETDTEVAAALIDYYYKNTNDMLEAIKLFKKNAKGSYALSIMCEDKPDVIYAIKNMSPLIIGCGSYENFIASDVPAIVEFTKNYISLEDGEYALVYKDKIVLYGKDDLEKKPIIKTYSEEVSSISKGEYEHFMLKEINEEPVLAKKLINKYINNKEVNDLPDLKVYNNITIVACGSAYHAGLVGAYLIEKYLNIKVSVEIASEFRYKKLFLNDKSLVIVISQSGETADTLEAVKISKKYGAKTLGIVNVKESSIARETDEVIYTEAGSEIAVATTKAYFSQCLILAFLCLKGMNVKKNDYDKVADVIRKLIDKDYDDLVSKLKDKNDVFFIGRLIDYALCMEGSLKLKEISYVHSDAYAAGELKHGTISLIENDTPVFAIITDKDITEKTISNIKEVKARGAYVILLISEDLDIDGDFYNDKIVIPSTNSILDNILAIVPLQVIAYKIALLRGCSIDKPRNLAKSVTVE